MQQHKSQPQWVVVVPCPTRTGYHGDGKDILLQGFHWESYRSGAQGKSWYRVLIDNAAAIRAAGFTWVWFPPSSDSLDPHGYLPRRWHQFNSWYGSDGELQQAIRVLHPVKALADLILNHRVGAHTPGPDFEDPPFADNRAAVVRDDECGQGTGQHDSGEMYPGGRDLDHSNPDVRRAVKEYLQRLQALGFRGWRYDFTKGFHGRYVAEYNDATTPEFSVGEFFDGDRQKVCHWLDDAAGKSTSFDFPTRYLLHDAIERDDYGNLRSSNHGRTVPGGLIGFWPSRAVTFLDNHDTEHRREQDLRYRNDGTRHFDGNQVALGYAYLFTHPGIPSVFWPHYFDWGGYTRERIDRLIRLRQEAGIHASSHVDIRDARHRLYAAYIDNRVALRLGHDYWHPGGGWHQVIDGDRFTVWRR